MSPTQYLCIDFSWDLDECNSLIKWTGTQGLLPFYKNRNHSSILPVQRHCPALYATLKMYINCTTPTLSSAFNSSAESHPPLQACHYEGASVTETDHKSPEIICTAPVGGHVHLVEFLFLKLLLPSLNNLPSRCQHSPATLAQQSLCVVSSSALRCWVVLRPSHTLFPWPVQTPPITAFSAAFLALLYFSTESVKPWPLLRRPPPSACQVLSSLVSTSMSSGSLPWQELTVFWPLRYQVNLRNTSCHKSEIQLTKCWSVDRQLWPSLWILSHGALIPSILISNLLFNQTALWLYGLPRSLITFHHLDSDSHSQCWFPFKGLDHLRLSFYYMSSTQMALLTLHLAGDEPTRWHQVTILGWTRPDYLGHQAVICSHHPSPMVGSR